MKLVDASLKNPTAVAVSCILVLVFGAVALVRIPVQMTPTVETPEITVTTVYPGAAPQEVEQQVTIPMEEQLNAVEGLRRMTSTSNEGMSMITMEFDWGVDSDRAIADIRDRLDLVENLPDEIERPQIRSAAAGANARPSFWMVGRGSISTNELRELADDVITPRMLRVEGVADVQQYGGEEREIQVFVDLEALRARNLTVPDVRRAILSENVNVRGGDLDSGRRRYLVRTVGQFESIEDLRRLIISRPGSGVVRLGDVAEIVDGFEDRDFEVRFMGEPALAFGVVKKTGANVIQVVRGVREAMAELNAQIGSRGVQLEAAYDETEYIWDSITMVNEALAVGAFLAIAVLLIFLRSPSSVFIIAVDIPVCLVGAIILLWATGRTVNIVSLAGLAFSVGIVVDNSIVVLENIFRRRERGDDPVTAARRGGSQVGMAVVASTLTNVAVFAPIVLIREEAGQLFADLALSITFATIASLIMALYVTPVACAKFLHLPSDHPHLAVRRSLAKRIWHGIHVAADRFDLRFIGVRFADLYRWTIDLVLRSRLARLGVLTGLTLLFAVSVWLQPPAEYLPNGNQNLFLTIMRMPPGLTLEELDARMGVIEQRFLHAQLPLGPVGESGSPEMVAPVERMFAVAGRSIQIIGLIVKRELSDRATMQMLNGAFMGMAQGVPGVQFAIVLQTGLFQRGLGGGRNIEVDITGPDLDRLVQISEGLQGAIMGLEGVQLVRSSYQAGNPELRVKIHRELAAELGLSVSDIATVVQAAIGGTETGLYRVGGKEYDIRVRSDQSVLDNPDALRSALLTQPSGRTLPLSQVAEVEETSGPVEISHVEKERSITLTVDLAETAALETIINRIQTEIVDPLRERLPVQYRITLAGSADDLARTRAAMAPVLLLAIVITYLLLAAIFESFWYPVLIILVVPFAWTGGFLGLWLFRDTSEYNVITQFGFIILVGCVVNNAILIVAQALDHLRVDGMEARQALVEACMSRLRPIFMSTGTSILGMLPLALGQGAGSELYRGLAIVVVGGLTLTTFFTLLLVPTTFLVFHRIREMFAGRERVHHFEVAPGK
ncbi:MAG: efflux RND transporter permease subunit [Candidatus Sumerlaeia bacterium]|nr:efflux RND transporter permease subunit [Candidatus Sumerlaeia bacterium]